jgi:NADH-quinone oxidoreductase subunit L
MSDAHLGWLVVLAIAAPLVPPLLLASSHWVAGPSAERVVHRSVIGGLAVAFVALITASVGWWLSGRAVVDVELGSWFSAGGYHFPLGVRLDRISVPIALTVVSLCTLVARFSIHYLHRERGYTRFFALLSVAAAGLLCVTLSNGYDQLFLGWECLGLSSVFLVAFFHERAGPPVGALRVLSTYRFCDLGLLGAGVLLHGELGSGEYERAFSWGRDASQAELSTLVCLGLLLAATGKSALFPLGGWLPRAMEGPTPSSALFYGGLSVHAGAFLLLRSMPLLSTSPVAMASVITVGALTTSYAALVGRVQFDAKGQLAYATMAQVGLIVVEIGLGLETLAVVHIITHASLRTFQLLRAPNLLRDAREMTQLLDRTRLPQERGLERALSSRIGVWLHHVALERFFLDAVIERVVGAVLALARATARLEDRLIEHPRADRKEASEVGR